jgi:hypothetical protein
MAHHKRKRPKNRRSGCLWCKYWKINGAQIHEKMKHSEYTEYLDKEQQIKELKKEQ